MPDFVVRLQRARLECGGVFRMDEEGGAAVGAGLEQVDALLGGGPAIDDEVVEFFAEEFVDYAFVLAADFKEVSERADGRHAWAERAGLEELAHGVGGVAVVADERLERVAAAAEGSVLAAKLVGAGAGGVLFIAARLESFAQGDDFAFERFEAARWRSQS